MQMRFLSLVTSVFFSLVTALGASALAIDPSNSGLDQAAGCSDSLCFSTIYDDLTSSGALTGDIEISGSTLTFNIVLASANLAATGGDGPVTSIDFTSVVYSGSVSVTPDVSDNYIVDSGQTATVSGTVTPNGAGSASGIVASTVLITGLCSGTPGSDLQCGFVFGPQMDFAADVNGNTRSFRHTVDAFAVVPEPGTALLVGAGMMGLALLRRD